MYHYREKKRTPNPEGTNQYKVRGQNDPQPKTSEKIGKQHNVSDKNLFTDTERTYSPRHPMKNTVSPKNFGQTKDKEGSGKNLPQATEVT